MCLNTNLCCLLSIVFNKSELRNLLHNNSTSYLKWNVLLSPSPPPICDKEVTSFYIQHNFMFRWQRTILGKPKPQENVVIVKMFYLFKADCAEISTRCRILT